MKIKNIVSVAICSIVLSACAGQSGDTKTAQNTNGKICKYEKTTGSHIGTKICRTPAQIKAEQAAARELMENSTRGMPAGSN